MIVEIIRTKKSVVNTSARPTCGHVQIRGNVSQKTSCVMVDRIVRMERMRNHAHIICAQVWDARLGVIHQLPEACVFVHKDTNLMRDSNELALTLTSVPSLAIVTKIAKIIAPVSHVAVLAPATSFKCPMAQKPTT
jgi:hypothetical protein